VTSIPSPNTVSDLPTCRGHRIHSPPATAPGVCMPQSQRAAGGAGCGCQTQPAAARQQAVHSAAGRLGQRGTSTCNTIIVHHHGPHMIIMYGTHTHSMALWCLSLTCLHGAMLASCKHCMCLCFCACSSSAAKPVEHHQPRQRTLSLSGHTWPAFRAECQPAAGHAPRILPAARCCSPAPGCASRCPPHGRAPAGHPLHWTRPLLLPARTQSGHGCLRAACRGVAAGEHRRQGLGCIVWLCDDGSQP
jgi:hypothetical protein